MPDDLFGPGSFLGGILGMNQNSSGTPGWGSLGGTGGNVPQAGPQMGPQVGPLPGAAPPPGPAPGAAGAPMDISAQGPGGNSPGLLGSLLSKFGGGQQQNPNAPSFAQKAAGLGQQYLKNANQPLKPATFAPMQLQGPIPQNMNLV